MAKGEVNSKSSSGGPAAAGGISVGGVQIASGVSATSTGLAATGQSPGNPKHVKVVVRTRPTSNFAQDLIRFDSDQKSVHIHIPKGSDGGFINNQQENWDFRFDNLLHNVSQEKLYDECGVPIVKSVLEGYHGTIMAYGQTGAGKTFTMTGATENYKHRGLIPRALSHLFREIAERPQFAYTVRISYLEIYNEQIVDLLSSISNESIDPASMTVGLTVQIANSEEEALNLLFEGETNRSIAEHQLNKSSTRSHCIFTVYIESRSRVESSEKVISSKLNLVDLAGSERISKTHTQGVSMKEAMYINKSLTFLEQVIIALADKKRDHIPYRQSKLTHVLRDSLGGSCNTLMIANIWGERDHIEETISTLRFATRMMCVTNTPELNVQFDPLALIKKYEHEIQDLKQELAMHDALASRSHISYEVFGESQRMELQKQVKAYLRDEEPELEVVSLRQIREVFNQFKILYRMLESEKDELVGTIKKMVANPGMQLGGGLVGDKGVFDGDTENLRHLQEFDRDDCVGEAETAGFSVGLAPLAPGSKVPKSASVLGNAKKKKPPTTGKAPGTSGAISAQNDNALKLDHEDDDERDEHLQPGAPFGLPPLPTNPLLKSTKPQGSNMQSGYSTNANFTSGAGGLAISSSATSRSEEFENFKRTRGADIYRILGENKCERESARTFIEDHVHVTVSNASPHTLLKGGDELVIDEEEYAALEKLKSIKQQYREGVDQLRQTRLDIGYCSKLVDQCRQKLMNDFEQWYELSYGRQLNDMDGLNGHHEDVMDIGEKFDRLQVERMSQEDPDSLPYYNARKNTERKLQRGKQRG
ncbi:P-loop containing nucleoside triphosphate hydrolase protein [Zopfochytrium polystomum]|nr:P-loop containing nucleoside triphosphate hydrolase protein [Zopfochytrium polystomum]